MATDGVFAVCGWKGWARGGQLGEPPVAGAGLRLAGSVLNRNSQTTLMFREEEGPTGKKLGARWVRGADGFTAAEPLWSPSPPPRRSPPRTVPARTATADRHHVRVILRPDLRGAQVLRTFGERNALSEIGPRIPLLSRKPAPRVGPTDALAMSFRGSIFLCTSHPRLVNGYLKR